MLTHQASYTYVESEGVRIFTAVLLPNPHETFPTVLIRTPYVDALEKLDEEEICSNYLKEYHHWLSRGYAIVLQHCRGRGKSDGDCVPYINERKDGLTIQAWIREQPFYNGELFLKGNSYLSTVHYVTAPFASDIKGAIFHVMDTERYRVCYRNGCFKIGLHGNWYVKMYHAKAKRKKN